MTFSPLLSLLELAPRLRSASDRTLSIYVPVRAEGYDSRHYHIVFGDLVHRYRERLDDEDRVLMERELSRLHSKLEVVRPAACAALAGFSDPQSGLLELIKLPAATEERLEVGQALLAPALRQIERFPSALVAVVDKEQARLFGFILDDLMPLEHLAGVPVRHTKAGGSSAPSNQRKGENRAKANLQGALDAVSKEMATGAYARLYLAGPQEARSEFESMIPAALRSLVAGHLAASLDSATLEQDLHAELRSARTAGAAPRA